MLCLGASVLALLAGACAEAPTMAEVERTGRYAPAKDTAAADTQADPQALLRLAEATLAGGNPAVAAGIFHRAARAAPGDLTFQVKVGFILHQLGALVEADAAFRRALAVDLGDSGALRGLGITLIARDMPNHAIEYLEEAVAASPDPRAYSALGVALDMVGERGAAQQAYREGLGLDPGNLGILNNLGLSLALSGQHGEAIVLLGQAVQDQRATPRHRQNLALAYGLAGRSDKAAEVANNDLDMRQVQNNLGYYAWLRTQPDAAETPPLGVGLAMGAISAEPTDTAVFAPPPPAGPTVVAPEYAGPNTRPNTGAGQPLPVSPMAAGGVKAQTAAIPEVAAETDAGQDTVIWELLDIQSDETADPKDPAKAGPAGSDSGATLPASKSEQGDEQVVGVLSRQDGDDSLEMQEEAVFGAPQASDSAANDAESFASIALIEDEVVAAPDYPDSPDSTDSPYLQDSQDTMSAGLDDAGSVDDWGALNGATNEEGVDIMSESAAPTGAVPHAQIALASPQPGPASPPMLVDRSQAAAPKAEFVPAVPEMAPAVATGSADRAPAALPDASAADMAHVPHVARDDASSSMAAKPPVMGKSNTPADASPPTTSGARPAEKTSKSSLETLSRSEMAANNVENVPEFADPAQIPPQIDAAGDIIGRPDPAETQIALATPAPEAVPGQTLSDTGTQGLIRSPPDLRGGRIRQIGPSAPSGPSVDPPGTATHAFLNPLAGEPPPGLVASARMTAAGMPPGPLNWQLPVSLGFLAFGAVLAAFWVRQRVRTGKRSSTPA